ncbi:MAG: hypothetical protein M1823_002010 [Watsoniomyces obsoletus]|nr:MAG: hypothetical protein M1823_002010 [Watsoniomyces obsoletus]
MRAASRSFFLAVFALLGSSHASDIPTRSRTTRPETCAIEPKATVSDTCVSYATLDALNAELSPALTSITHATDFFAYYRLNLFHQTCPFWSDESSMCGNIACAVQTLDHEEDIPEIWRAKELGKLEGPKAEHPDRRQQRERLEKPLQGELGEDVRESCVVEYDDECDDRDYCVPEDESATGKGDYVSLVDNPERFTGYAGPGPRQVWDAIYRENCFAKSRQTTTQSASRLSPFGEQASRDLKSVIRQHGRQQALASKGVVDDVVVEFDDECLEKRVFYRIISGMHASINTHLCWDHLNQTTGQWGPNLQCYQQRLHSHPEWISNVYFNYALVLRAVGKLRGHLQRYTFCSGDPPQDQMTKQKVVGLAESISSGPQIFDESLMFKDPAVLGLKDDFRHRFRNVSRLMDCVGCDKCRLWGKLQTAGYGTALKVLFDFDEDVKTDDNDDNEDAHQLLRRTELVALMNTLDRISHSLSAIGKFRQMMQGGEVHEEIITPASGDQPPRRSSGQHSKKGESKDKDDVEDVIDQERPLTLKEEFWIEWYRVWDALKFVIRGWLAFPGVAFEIFILEMSRAWDFWLGLPVRPRTWEIKWPDHTEL